MEDVFDVVIIGDGIAGASLAADLAADHKVLVLERENLPGYHTTGRSAAVYSETYGNEVIRKLTVLSRSFFEAPPNGFSDISLWRDRRVVLIGRADQSESLRYHYETTKLLAKNLNWLDADEVKAMVPILETGYAAAGVLEPDAKELDVHAIHSGYLRQTKQRGGQLVTNAEVRSLFRQNNNWTVETKAGTFRTKIVINAAGAWVDEIASLAGLQQIGVQPLRRTALTIAFDHPDAANWPVVIDVDENFYFKPETGCLFCSPADETKMAPCDVQPDEMDIAITVDRIEKATTLRVKKILSSWAGLRTFAPDRTTVVGFDRTTDNFFWLAGQGGYGIQTCPAMACAAAHLIRHGALPTDHLAAGLSEAILSPDRFMKMNQ